MFYVVLMPLNITLHYAALSLTIQNNMKRGTE